MHDAHDTCPLGSQQRARRAIRHRQKSRRGAVLILTVFLIVAVVGMLAFAIDLGYISVVRCELQRSADAAALAGAYELLDFDELTGSPTPATAHAEARQAARDYAVLNPAGAKTLGIPSNDENSPAGDLVLGYVPDPADPDSMEYDDETAYNSLRVKLRRDAVANDPVSLFFAPVFGVTQQSISVEAVAIFDKDVKGFKYTPGRPNPLLLPFTLLIDDWNDAFVNGQDNFTHDAANEAVSGPGDPDGIKEIKLFPWGTRPGNFGSIDIGAASNSTSVQERQILEGPNAEDMSYFPDSTIELDSTEPLILNGNTGISAAVKDELAQIVGQPRIIPLYSTVVDTGNNADFTIVKWVGVTIVDVKLQGSMNSKHFTIQPCFVIDPTAVHGGLDGTTSKFVRIPLSLIK